MTTKTPAPEKKATELPDPDRFWGGAKDAVKAAQAAIAYLDKRLKALEHRKVLTEAPTKTAH